MKKLFTLILFVFILTKANAQSFGPDRIAFLDTTYDVKKPFISVAFNGWIYIAFNYHLVGASFSGYIIDVSKDNGLTWETIADFQTIPLYPVTLEDMIVAGTDTSNLRVFVVSNFWSPANPLPTAGLTYYNAITGHASGNYLTIGDGQTFSIGHLALCSDSKHPYLNSSPYTVALAYIQYGGSDSVFVNYSFNGGDTFDGSHVVASTQIINNSNIDIAYGSYGSPAVGRYLVVWDQNGNIGASQSDAGVPTSFSGFSLLDTIYPNLSGLLHNPIICIQSAEYANASGDYSTAILAERYDSSTSTNDIVGFFNNDTQNGGFGYPAVLDSSSDNTIQPSVSFDETNGNFIATWFNQTKKELPCLYHDMNFPGPWTILSTNYADTSSFSNPFPLISANGPMNDISVCWIQEKDTADLFNSRGILKYDATALPLLISTKQTNDKIKISPNVSTGSFELIIDKEIIHSKTKLEIYNSLSDLVYSENIQSSTCDVIKKYDLSLSPGVYFVKLNNSKRKFSQKIIIQ